MIKRFFYTPKKAAIITIGALAILAFIGTASVFAVTSVAENTSIGADKASLFAFADAGVDPVSARNVQSEFEFENGRFIYEVDFISDETKYDYWIQASDGTVIKKNVKILNQNNTNKDAEVIPTTDASAVTIPDAADTANDDAAAAVPEAPSDDADTAYDDAAAAVPEVPSDDADTAYDDAASAIPEVPSDADISPLSEPSADVPDAPVIDLGPADEPAEAFLNPQKNGEGSGFIGIDRAKEIALNHAGKSSSSVSFSKVKLDDDDGEVVYEIEFYIGSIEYDYEIDAYSGTILEYEIDND